MHLPCTVSRPERQWSSSNTTPPNAAVVSWLTQPPPGEGGTRCCCPWPCTHPSPARSPASTQH
eukprot:1171457-Prorocentrum_lima.AAC.1